MAVTKDKGLVLDDFKHSSLAGELFLKGCSPEAFCGKDAFYEKIMREQESAHQKQIGQKETTIRGLSELVSRYVEYVSTTKIVELERRIKKIEENEDLKPDTDALRNNLFCNLAGLIPLIS